MNDRLLHALTRPATTALASTAAAMVTPYTVAVDVAEEGRRRRTRLAEQAAIALAETLVTLRAARVVLLKVAEAMEAGLVDELVAGLRDISDAVALIERVSGQIDRALPVLDATAPTLGLMNNTLAQLDATLAQLQSMPGVRMAKRLVGRPSTAGAAERALASSPAPALVTATAPAGQESLF